MALAIGCVGVLQFFLFRSEQYRLIDSRIESTATLLVSSNLTSADLQDFEEAEDIIREVVGGERFNQFIIIYGRTGKELYRSSNAVGLPKIPAEPKWQTIDSDGHLIRVLTLPLDHPIAVKRAGRGPTRTLQTGLLLNEDLLRMQSLSRNVIVFSVLILGLIIMTTIWLSEALLRPLKELALYLRHLGSNLNASPVSSERAPQIPYAKGNDEFGQLMQETERLRVMIGQGLKNTQVWTAQMAHEMKTPLTILQNTLERAKVEQDGARRERFITEASEEIAHLNGLISSFLEWSAAENFPGGADEVHAIKLAQRATELAEKFERQYPGRIRVQGESGKIVFAKRGFVQQAISNLITNALRYSQEGSPVVIRLAEDRVEIVDEGPGLPPAVLERLGEPFNYMKSNVRGFGLGLAWVRTICSKYGWSLVLERRKETSDGREREVTVAGIRFPVEED
jgi:signal transduction histidine kinase